MVKCDLLMGSKLENLCVHADSDDVRADLRITIVKYKHN